MLHVVPDIGPVFIHTAVPRPPTQTPRDNTKLKLKILTYAVDGRRAQGQGGRHSLCHMT